MDEVMDVITLAEAPVATPLTLSAVPDEHAWRLSRLGLRPGTAFSVIRASAGGGRIVSVAGSRVALGSALLRGLLAEVAR
ncbi:MAG: ferrous iron transport protein A [Micropruina sp.]|uniref:FeoA family protein n=1 Tax=Micropruina sp. TaxID=2737536 RepID=UPI0039E627FE